MVDLIIYAIPAFVALLVVEATSFRLTGDDQGRLIGYARRDTATSLTMGLGNVVINVAWQLVVVAMLAACYEATPLRMPTAAWWSWVAIFFCDDLAYYAFHRVSHEMRLFWASHVVHHSSRHYNLSTALRQTWVPMTYFPFWLPLALLGFKPWMILAEQAVSLTYQFWIHTERIGRLPRPIELILNTPSHHRVHHGSNDIYLDRNYGGILIVWDRLFGSFQDETERVRYGLTKNLQTHRPTTVAFHEYAAIARDVRGAHGWRERLGYVFGGPAWRPGDPRPQLSAAAATAADPRSAPAAGR